MVGTFLSLAAVTSTLLMNILVNKGKLSCNPAMYCLVEVSGSSFKVRFKNSSHRFAVPLLPDNLQGSCQTHSGTLTLHQRLIPSPTALYPGKITST